MEKKIKQLQRALARHGLIGSVWLFEHIPYWAVMVLSNVLIFIGYTFTIRHKRIAAESISIAFEGEKSEKDIKSISKQCFLNIGRGMIEMFYFLSHPEMVEERITVEGYEHLEKALEKGNGVVAVTAHFGNFPLMMYWLVLQKYICHCIIRPTRDPLVEKYLMEKRRKVGLKTIYAKPREKCVQESLKALRNNEILFIPLDQNFGSAGGVFVDFFGQKAATATGPVVFAGRTEAVILPMFIVRVKDDRHKIFIEPPVKLEQYENEQQSLIQNTQKITDKIEQYIRRYPHEWGWMHRRWKSQTLRKRKPPKPQEQRAENVS